jgi:pyruvate-ferredoxin/flavodoxin oxidoreductase
MQTCFFSISGILPPEESISSIKKYIQKTYGIKGESIVNKNFNAVDKAVENLIKIEIPDIVTGIEEKASVVPNEAPDFVKTVIAEIISGNGDNLPVSAMPVDGTFPTATTQWEKRNITTEIPVWNSDICIQCNKCALVCPHGVIRMKIYDDDLLESAPETYKSAKVRGKGWETNEVYTLQVAPEDCTGCSICVEICPVKDKSNVSLKAINMENQVPIRESERNNWDFFLNIPEVDRGRADQMTVKGSQLLQPLFEFSGACAGCGETPYVKLASQLFGDRMIIANATGCSSIYGGNLPTTPWAVNKDGRGPTWSNSLFEDNAEFGLGFRLTIDNHIDYAKDLLNRLKNEVGDDLVEQILSADQSDEPGIYEQRQRVDILIEKLTKINNSNSQQLLSVVDNLVKKSVWIMGGDGWAYDIGFGGLDHVFASGRDVNILVLDTEVYSNTGGQASKSTPLGAVAKFAASGKATNKKDLGMIAMSYGNIYVAQIAMGASDAQTMKAFMEAESYPGPSLIIAYSHCIAHGYDMAKGMDQQKKAVQSGHWMMYRHDPRRIESGKNPLMIDSKKPSIPIGDYIYNENRYNMLKKLMPERAGALLDEAQIKADERYNQYKQISQNDIIINKKELVS